MTNLQQRVTQDRTPDHPAELIERWIKQKTHGQIWNLSVDVRAGAVYLQGRCKRYFTKQLALQAALEICAGFESLANSEVHNAIEVRSELARVSASP